MTSNEPNPARRFRMLLLSALAASATLTPLALWYLHASGTPLRLHLVIALTLAITLSMLLAAVLMGLVFHSAASGHDRRVSEENAAIEPDVWKDI